MTHLSEQPCSKPSPCDGLSHFILTMTPGGMHCCWHFTDKETEAQRGESVTGFKSSLVSATVLAFPSLPVPAHFPGVAEGVAGQPSMLALLGDKVQRHERLRTWAFGIYPLCH